jgi:hypothetical protein
MEFRFPRESGDDAELVLVTGLEDGHPVIQVSVANVDPFERDKPYPRIPNWQLAIDSSRRLLTGPMSALLFASKLADVRRRIASSFREGTAGLPEPIPGEMHEVFRRLEAPWFVVHSKDYVCCILGRYWRGS